MAYNRKKTREWGLTTPNNGLYLNEEFDQIYENFNEFLENGNLIVKNDNAVPASIRITNQTTGHDISDGLLIELDPGGDGNISLQESGDLVIKTSNIDRLRILSTGQIGIGNVDPDSFNSDANSLVIQENGNCGITISGSDTGNSSIYFGDSGDNDVGMIAYDHSNDALRIWTNNYEQMTIDSAGDIVISGDLTAASCNVGSGAISGGDISGTSLAVGGALTGSSLNVSSGTISGGTITGSSLDVTGQIEGGTLNIISGVSINSDGRLSISGVSTAGLLIGEDCKLYKNGTMTLYTPGNFTVGGTLNMGGVSISGNLVVDGSIGIGTAVDTAYSISAIEKAKIITSEASVYALECTNTHIDGFGLLVKGGDETIGANEICASFQSKSSIDAMKLYANGTIMTRGATKTSDSGGLNLSVSADFLSSGVFLDISSPSAVAHGMTEIAPTNVYARFMALHTEFFPTHNGGLRIMGLFDDDAVSNNVWALQLDGYNSMEGSLYSPTNASARGVVSINAYKRSGTSAVPLTGNECILSVGCGFNQTRFYIQGDGDVRNDGTYTSWDTENDIMLAGALKNELTGWSEKTATIYKKRLEELGIVSEGFMSTNKFRALMLGSISQIWNIIRHQSKRFNISELELFEMAKNYD